MTDPFLKLRRPLAAGLALLVLAAQPAASQQVAPQPSGLDVPALRTMAVAGSMLAAGVVAHQLRNRLPHATCAPCDPAGLWGVDRAVIGLPRRVPGRISDATLLLATAGAGVLLATADGGRGPEELAVYVTTMSVASATAAWAKVLFQRPRPVRYTVSAAEYADAGDGLSFPSGHATLAFAAAGAYASLAHRRGDAGRRGGVTAALFGTAAATATLRVSARRHFPTDVLAGALLGTVVGWTVPAVWPRP